MFSGLRSRRRKTGIALCLTVFLFLWGCSTAAPAPVASSNTPASTPAAPAYKPPTGGIIRIYDPRQNDANRPTVLAQLSGFTRDTKIEIENLVPPGTEPFLTKLATLLASGSPLDVWHQDGVIGSYVSQKIPEPLNAYITRDNIDLSQISSYALKLNTVDGKLYSIPTQNYVQMLAFNVDLFDQAGVPHPPSKHGDPTWTYDEMINRAKRLTKFEGGKMVQAGLWDVHHFWYPWMFGGFQLTPDGKAMDTTSPGWIAGLRAIQDLFHVHKVSPSDADLAEMRTAAGQSNIFLGGRAAMYVISSSQYATFVQDKNVKWKLAPLPTGMNTFTYQEAGGYAILESSKEKDRAWELLKWVANPVNNKLVAASYGRPPVVLGALTQWVKDQEVAKPGVNWTLVEEGVNKFAPPERGMQYVQHPIYREIQPKVWNVGINKLIKDRESPEAVARWMKEEGDRIFATFK